MQVDDYDTYKTDYEAQTLNTPLQRHGYKFFLAAWLPILISSLNIVWSVAKVVLIVAAIIAFIWVLLYCYIYFKYCTTMTII